MAPTVVATFDIYYQTLIAGAFYITAFMLLMFLIIHYYLTVITTNQVVLSQMLQEKNPPVPQKEYLPQDISSRNHD